VIAFRGRSSVGAGGLKPPPPTPRNPIGGKGEGERGKEEEKRKKGGDGGRRRMEPPLDSKPASAIRIPYSTMQLAGFEWIVGLIVQSEAKSWLFVSASAYKSWIPQPGGETNML